MSTESSDFPPLTDIFNQGTTETASSDTTSQETPRRTRARKERSDKGRPRGRAASTKGLAEELLVPYAKLARQLSYFAPTVSAVLIHRGEQTVDGLVNIAKDHPRMLAALKKGAKIGPMSELAETIAMIGIAFLIDMGRLKPDHPWPKLTGVTALWEQVQPSDMQEHYGPPMDGPPMPPFPASAMNGAMANGGYAHVPPFMSAPPPPPGA